MTPEVFVATEKGRLLLLFRLRLSSLDLTEVCPGNRLSPRPSFLHERFCLGAASSIGTADGSADTAAVPFLTLFSAGL